MSKALVNGINIHYQTSGSGEDLVLIHGATGNMAFWYMSSLPALIKEFRVTAYDLRGHGYSDLTPSGYTSADMSVDLRALLDHLKIEKAHLVGHSFGGVIALHTAALYPERVESLVLADPEIPALRHLCDFKKWPYWEVWKARLSEYGVDVPDEKWDDLDYVIRQSLCIPVSYGLKRGKKRDSKRLLRLLENTSAIDEFRGVSGLTMDSICRIKHPTLAIYGELSPFLPVCHFLKENLKNCKSVIVPTGHFHPGLEPEVFVGHVIGFLRNPKGYIEQDQPEKCPVTSTGQRCVLDNLKQEKDRKV